MTACNTQAVNNVNKNEAVQEKQSIKWEITDISGKQQMLDIGHVMEMDQSMGSMADFYYLADYAQNYQGHFYYMSVADEVYTIYKDHGEEVGRFRCDGYDLLGCTKYEDHFYVKFQDKKEDMIYEFGVVDFENESIKSLHQTGDFGISIYKDEVYYCYDNRITVKNFEGNVVKTFDFPDECSRGMVGIDEKNLYYTINDEEKGTIRFLCVNRDTGGKSTVFEYKRNKSVPEFKGAMLEKRGNTIYLEERVGLNAMENYFCLYIIDEKKKKMQMVSAYVDDWEESKQYVFYTDKHHTIHRWDKENGKEKVISKIKAEEIFCVADELYVREYDKLMDEGLEEWDPRTDTLQQDIYTMDFDGKNVEMGYRDGHFFTEKF